MGLSYAHISPRHAPQRFAATIAVGGALLRLRSFGSGRKGGGERGKVSGFSRGSRSRMLDLFNSVNRDEVKWTPIMVTLTYPGEWNHDPETWKRDLDAFGKAALRHYSKVAIIWKLEPQQRGAPHFHLAVFGEARLDIKWVSETWYRIVGSGDVRHLRAGTRVEHMKSWKGASSYYAKYAAKAVDADGWPEYVGRWWGVIGRANLPIRMELTWLERAEWYAMRRVIYGYLRRRGVQTYVGATAGAKAYLYAPEAERLLHYYIGGDSPPRAAPVYA